MPRYVLGKKIFFTNNLPYIGILEYGGFPKPVKKGSRINRANTRSYRATVTAYKPQGVGLGLTLNACKVRLRNYEPIKHEASFFKSLNK